MLIKSQSLSELFYTVDTYGTFSTDYLDDYWQEESEFDHKGFMKDLAELHVHVINQCLPAGGVESVWLIDTYSPREYNFRTDQAELGMKVDIDKLYRYLQMHNNEEEFAEFLKENFTSRDGFWSFTPNNLKDFYGAVDGTLNDSVEDRDKCVAILAGWYLTRECMTEQEYLDSMWDGVGEIMHDNFEQFTDETIQEYYKYVDDFNRHKESQTALSLEDCGQNPKYPLDIEEWAEEGRPHGCLVAR